MQMRLTGLSSFMESSEASCERVLSRLAIVLRKDSHSIFCFPQLQMQSPNAAPFYPPPFPQFNPMYPGPQIASAVPLSHFFPWAVSPQAPYMLNPGNLAQYGPPLVPSALPRVVAPAPTKPILSPTGPLVF